MLPEVLTILSGQRNPMDFHRDSPGISWIVPAFNEENAIASTVQRLEATLSKLGRPFEIIVVNDGSRDATALNAQNASANVRVISHPINTGYGSAIKTGIVVAQYEFLGIVDADGTYNIEQMPQLVEQMDGGFDMVVGARTGVLSLDGPMKRFFRKRLIGALNLVVAGRIVDPNSGFRMFTKSLAVTFFPFLCNTFSFTTSLTVFAFGQAFFVAYVPTAYTHRVGKSKVRDVRDSIRMVQLILEGITFFNALKFYVILVGLLVMLVGLPSAIMLAMGWPNLANLWALIGAASAMLIGIGVLGDIVRLSNMDRAFETLTKQRDRR